MKHKIFLFTFSLLIILFFGSFEQSFACSLGSETPSFCEMVGRADVIFIGKAVGAKKKKTIVEDGIEQVWDGGEIYFEVQEGFVGIKKGIRVTVRSGNEDGYCGTWFKHNESYLIYGFGNLKKGFVDGSRTKLVSEAQDDINSLKDLPKAGAGSRIFGLITQDVKSSLFKDYLQPIPNVMLKIQQFEGNNRPFEIFTDSKGYYEINGIPAGKYKIIPTLPAFLKFWNTEIEVKDRGCAKREFYVRNKTEVNGKVLDAEDNPVSEIFVEFLPTELSEKPKSKFLLPLSGKTLTEEDGRFTFKNVPPGNYQLSINYLSSPSDDDPFPTTFYPNAPERLQAQIFNVEFGSKNIENIEFRLPPRLETQEIKGILVEPDGTPIFDAHVALHDAEDDLVASDCRTDKSGNFILKGFVGRKYYISADTYLSDKTAESATYVLYDKFAFDKEANFFRIVVEN